MDLAGRTELHLACLAGHADAVASLLATGGHDPLGTTSPPLRSIFLFNIFLIFLFSLVAPGQDRYGYTAWHYAVIGRSRECLALLRSHTASTLLVQVNSLCTGVGVE
jgi:ankyrin repeat protein